MWSKEPPGPKVITFRAFHCTSQSMPNFVYQSSWIECWTNCDVMKKGNQKEKSSILLQRKKWKQKLDELDDDAR